MIKDMRKFSKNIAIDAPDLTEWVPMSFALNPSISSTISVTADLKYFRRVSWVIYLSMPYLITENMNVSSFSPGRIRVFWTKEAADRTVKMTGSPVDSCVFLYIFTVILVLKC